MNADILVVDDDESILETVREALELHGYHVRTALNGAEALDRVEAAPPDLVLLDMRMPVMDGWGFASALRGRQLELPVVVMSAAQDARRWAIEVGASQALPKPFEIDELLTTVDRALAGS